ncbi:MAG: TetR/AcrR family transcriptional regulator [Candidatus Binataceae bacterium]
MDTEIQTPTVRKRRRYTQIERRALSDQRMLDAALKLIARQGSSRTTLAEIGDAAGYTYGLITNRFGSKGNLIRAVTRYVQSYFARRTFAEVESLTGLAALKALVQTYLTRVDSPGRRALYVLIGEALGPVPEIRPDMAQADENFRRNLQKQIERGVASGEIRSDLDPGAQAALMVATLRGISFQRLINPSAFELERVSRELQANIEKTFRRPGTESEHSEQLN